MAKWVVKGGVAIAIVADWRWVPIPDAGVVISDAIAVVGVGCRDTLRSENKLFFPLFLNAFRRIAQSTANGVFA
jgi:hypothetical protein